MGTSNELLDIDLWTGTFDGLQDSDRETVKAAAERLKECEDFLEALDEAIEEALESAREVHKQFPNSYGAGQEIGMVDGLRKARALFMGDEE